MNHVGKGQRTGVVTEDHNLFSELLQRTVHVHVYRPAKGAPESPALLVLHDGQDLRHSTFGQSLGALTDAGKLQPLLVVAVHAGPQRLLEYGTAGMPDYAGRGVKAGLHHRFVLEELLPFIKDFYGIAHFSQQGIGGFSLGGLAALSMVWRHPEAFQTAGVFSGSLWWRSRALDQGYEEHRDRIMHHLVRQGKHVPGLRFYFTTGSLDETADRNGNGIIDSIDDTLGLIEELEGKGYVQGSEIMYTNYEDGRHDIATWLRALPQFLLWGWGRE